MFNDNFCDHAPIVPSNRRRRRYTIRLHWHACPLEDVRPGSGGRGQSRSGIWGHTKWDVSRPVRASSDGVSGAWASDCSLPDRLLDLTDFSGVAARGRAFWQRLSGRLEGRFDRMCCEGLPDCHRSVAR